MEETLIPRQILEWAPRTGQFQAADLTRALAEGTGRLDHALIEVEARETDVLSSFVQKWAEETGGIGFDSRAYAALMERARSHDARPHLPEGLRGTVDGLLARDERWAFNRDRVEAFLVRAAEAERARNALTQMDVTTSSFEERLQARQDHIILASTMP